MSQVVLAVFFSALAVSAAAKDIRVAEDGSGDYMKLSKALAAAVPGDMIVIKKPSGQVGAKLKVENDAFVIEGTLPGSPAEAAGLKSGDRVVTIDGVEIAGRSLSEVVMRVRGPVDSKVELKVVDASGEREVTIIRGAVRREVKDELSKMGIAREEEDYDTATAYAQKLADGGAVEAQSFLAFQYYNGKGVSKDPKKAFFWAARAAEGGNVEAQRLIGFFYQQGEGTTKDMIQALYWNKKAAEKNDPYALVNLGAAYEIGAGVQADPAAALELYRRALKQEMTSASRADAQSRVVRLETNLKASDASTITARMASDMSLAAERGAILRAASAAHAPAQPASPAAPVAAQPRRSDVDDLPAAAAVRPHAVAVVIGVESYRENLPKAEFAAGDAKLAAEYFRRVLGVSDSNLALLIDERAAKSDFEKYFERWLPNRVEAGDDVFVYFSGHGAPNVKSGDAYLVPFDGDPAYIEQTGYSLKKLYALLAKLPARKVYVAMDSCFSGAGGRSVIAKGTRPLISVKSASVTGNLTVLSASAGDQVSASYQEKGHGLFTYFLLKGMKEKGGDLKLVFDYLKPEVSRIARRDLNVDQEPQWREGK